MNNTLYELVELSAADLFALAGTSAEVELTINTNNRAAWMKNERFMVYPASKNERRQSVGALPGFLLFNVNKMNDSFELPAGKSPRERGERNPLGGTLASAYNKNAAS